MRMTIRDWTALGGALALAVSLAGCGGGDAATEPEGPRWARFRGPDGLGLSPEENLPVHWGEDGNGVRWTTEVPGPGVSSPIVYDRDVFLTGETIDEEAGETRLKVVSVDLETGSKKWETTVFTRQREDFPPRSVNNTSAGPTPVTDGETVFAYFGTHLAALDYAGELLWLHQVDPEYLDDVYYGAGSSLVLAGDTLLVLRDREKVEDDVYGWLAAYDKNGKRKWRKKWTDTCCSYTTPILYEGESGTEIIVSQAGRIQGFDLETGKRLWQQPQAVNQPVASPVLVGDLLCSASGGHGVKNASCWRMRANNKGNTRPTALWATPRGVSSIVSPLFYQGLFFSLSDDGVMHCFDPASGRVLWVGRLERGNYSSSLVGGDGKIYAFTRWGSSSVVAAAPQFELLAVNTLPHRDIVATPAIAGGCLLVRSKDHLMCVEGGDPPPPEPAEAAVEEAVSG